MSKSTINIKIPFSLLKESINGISIEEKIKIADILEDDIMKEFDELEKKALVKNEIKESRNAYKAGKYISLDGYIK